VLPDEQQQDHPEGDARNIRARDPEIMGAARDAELLYVTPRIGKTLEVTPEDAERKAFWEKLYPQGFSAYGGNSVDMDTTRG